MREIILASVVTVAVALFGCERQPAGTPAAGSSGTTQKKDDPAQKAGERADHDRVAKGDDKQGDHGGPVVDLGSTDLNGMNIKASRDAGELKPGGDAPIDVWINGGLGDAVAVRFWIGVEDAKGSLKAKAAVEEGKWHTHAEIPDPLPAGSKLWVEIEGKDSKKTLASFDLKK